jgi:hypothetical protein
MMNETGVSSDVRSCPVMTAGAFDSMATDVIGKRFGVNEVAKAVRDRRLQAVSGSRQIQRAITSPPGFGVGRRIQS